MFILLLLLLTTIPLSHQHHQNPYKLAKDLAYAYKIARTSKLVEHIFHEHYDQNTCDGRYRRLTHSDILDRSIVDGPIISRLNVTNAEFYYGDHILKFEIIAPSSTQTGKFRLNESALNSVLGHSACLNKKVIIISVAGAFRKGKSFLLNFFLEYLYSLNKSQSKDSDLEWLTDDCQLHGFHWRAGVKRDTVGIWLWGEPIMIQSITGEMFAVLLMDTQGTFDNTTTYQQCMTVFALSTIISSVQIYNVVDNIQEDALQHLSLFVEYGRMAMEQPHNFGKPFQNLVFCVRDFKNQEEYDFGEGGDFLENVLQVSDSQPDEIRQVRELLHEYFEDIQCYLLPYPGYKVAERQSFRGHVKDLRPIFREELKKMVPNLIAPHNMKPKMVNGKAVTCRKLIQYFKEYANSFDGETLPQPQSILNANVKLLCIEAAHEAKISYCRGMDRSTFGTRMMHEKKLLEAHIKHGITALNIYDKCPKIGSNEVRRFLLEKLQEDINAELERYKRLNEAKRVTGCASAMLACGDSVFLGLGLGTAASGAIAGAAYTLQLGVVTTGVVAIPLALTTIFIIWSYVYVKPCFKKLVNKDK